MTPIENDMAALGELEGTLLVFGGPYSNLRALKALRAAADELEIPPERVICTGDIVAYCAEPEDTVAEVRAWGVHAIQGNVEEQLAAGAGDCGCGFEDGTACSVLSHDWYSYADARITDESRAWMGDLPETLTFTHSGLSFRVIHGGVERTNKFIYPSTASAVKEQELASTGADVVLCGHSGIPFVKELQNGIWFNAGVIGLPANDGTPDVWYGLVERQESDLIFSLHRLVYAAGAAAAALRQSGHAEPYAQTLETGLWPSLDNLPEPDAAKTGRQLQVTKLTVKAKAPANRHSSPLRRVHGG